MLTDLYDVCDELKIKLIDSGYMIYQLFVDKCAQYSDLMESMFGKKYFKSTY